MAARRTRAKDLRRRIALRNERRTVVVFCEGVGSEPDYVNGLKQLPTVRGRTSLDLRIDPRHGVPLTLVEHAVDMLRDDEVDECWCIFDVEWPKNHPHLKRAVALASEHGVRVAVSNPCFELWLMLHFENHTAHISTEDAERRSRHLDGRDGKRIDPARYTEHRAVARERAEALARRHEKDGTEFPLDNPSSSMSDFVAALEHE